MYMHHLAGILMSIHKETILGYSYIRKIAKAITLTNQYYYCE